MTNQRRSLVRIRYGPEATEQQIQMEFCSWIRNNYPEIFFTSDLTGHIQVPIKFRQMHNNLFKVPDMFIALPRGKFHGLYMEIKKNQSEVFTKNGELRRSAHIRAQAETLAYLRNLGYYAVFTFGLQDCQDTLVNYIRFYS